MSQGKRWCFTLNNPTEDERIFLNEQFKHESVLYVVVGREIGTEGTPHLQGFIIFHTNQRFNAVKRFLGQRVHVEKARGTIDQAADYCQKDGEFQEWGLRPQSSQGKRTDFEAFRDWIKEQDTPPTAADVAEAFPSIYGRYRSNAMSMVQLLSKPPKLGTDELRGWQLRFRDQLLGEPDDRRITFVIDPAGGKGKSYFVRYMLENFTNKVQRLSVGKRDDLAHAIDISRSIFLFDIPRQQLEFLQYSVLEGLKDRMLFSPKYESTCKILSHNSHVVVFTNEEPDMTKLTRDRYIKKYLS